MGALYTGGESLPMWFVVCLKAERYLVSTDEEPKVVMEIWNRSGLVTSGLRPPQH